MIAQNDSIYKALQRGHGGKFLHMNTGDDLELPGGGWLTAMRASVVCGVCLSMWQPGFTESPASCHPRCAHCKARYEDHADGCCLFSPTRYAP